MMRLSAMGVIESRRSIIRGKYQSKKAYLTHTAVLSYLKEKTKAVLCEKIGMSFLRIKHGCKRSEIKLAARINRINKHMTNGDFFIIDFESMRKGRTQTFDFSKEA